jgi:histidine triad (HIT) family protein
MNDCIFCGIIASGKSLIWQNEVAVAFNDIKPDAKVHILVVPKRHIANLDELDDPELAGQLVMAVREVAAQVGVTGNYRMQVNNGRDAGQIVEHLHFHLLSEIKANQ